ncbi:MAG: rhodanese-like domain-containing protein [Alphaproteobacteria bacterium]|nr:rhodanese-like domain-containing protein [Alphaproteobacteria bacterium]QQS56983.1 MAG: rhodanese-like domain-containing protein [Alphaproteobacteria bacterium]
MTKMISVQEAAAWLAAGDAVLIDVREPDEFAQEHIVYAHSVPLASVERVAETLKIPQSRKVLFHCLKGGRGQQACAVVGGSQDFSHEIYNITGGITAWKEAGLPTVSLGPVPRFSIFRQVQMIAGAMVAFLVLLGFSGIMLGFVLAGLIGGALFFAGYTGFCGLAMVLKKAPWNNTNAGVKKGPCCGP